MKRLIDVSPGTWAGCAGMALVAILYIAHAVSVQSSGHGLSAAWLGTLVLPGVLAGHIAHRSPSRSQSPERAGLQAGLLTAHYAALLQVIVLIIGIVNVDWPAYAARVGPQIANGVHEMAAPAAAVASVALIAVTYTGCIVAAWLGALLYHLVYRLLNS